MIQVTRGVSVVNGMVTGGFLGSRLTVVQSVCQSLKPLVHNVFVRCKLAGVCLS